MTVLLRNAWLGWQNYIDYGKQAALLLAVLLFLCFTGKWKKQGGFIFYTIAVTAGCILPVTAAVLMLYQTKFYGYEWIWSIVPLTAVTAYGISVFLVGYWTDFRVSGRRAAPDGNSVQEQRAAPDGNSVQEQHAAPGECIMRGQHVIPVTALVLAAIVLSGGLGVQGESAGKEERERAYALLERVSEQYSGLELFLWAPREIMEYAREVRGDIRLPYGRNMWDISLDAYAYDIYDETVISLCEWMEQVQEEGSSQKISAEEIGEEIDILERNVENALAMGVNCIVLPGSAEEDVVRRMERILGVEALRWEDYYIFLAGLLAH